MKFFLSFIGLLAFLCFPAEYLFSAEAPAPDQSSQTAFVPKAKAQPIGPNTVLVIDDFNHLHSFNLMEGITQGDEEEPGGLIPSFTPSGNFTMGRWGHSLRMDYDVALPFSLAYYWTRFGSKDRSGQPGTFFTSNLEGFNYVSFWVKTVQEYPRFAIEIHQDSNKDHLFTLGKDKNPKMAVSSFIISPTEEISGNAAEIIVDVTPGEAAPGSVNEPTQAVLSVTPTADSQAPQEELAKGTVAALPPVVTSSGENSPPEKIGLSKKEENSQAKAGAQAVNPPPSLKPVPAPDASFTQRRSRKKAVFSYQQVPVEAMTHHKSETLKAMDEAEKAMIKPNAPKEGVIKRGKSSDTAKPVEQVSAPVPTIKVFREQKAKWRKVVVPLGRYVLVDDWSSILEMVFLFDNRLGSDKGIVYIDDIVFGTNYAEPMPEFNLKSQLQSINVSPLKVGVSPTMMKAFEMSLRHRENMVMWEPKDPKVSLLSSEKLSTAEKFSRDRLSQIFDFTKKQDLQKIGKVPEVFMLNFKIDPVDPTIESIRVELSYDRGKVWSIVSNLYNHQADGVYSYPWRIPKKFEKRSLLLRLVACDIWGRSKPLCDPIAFEMEVAA